ncbi:MAG: TetR family transcriptional regulator C-terminal domain-containing protein [Defluviitaleaceae bacterium]|nr:TetR family transcriptional regulator C-terminal domain-containing protein [Defluviitaleaceae bacterium]
MDKNDRRVRKTKKAIQEALAVLMLEKDLRSITVQELADKADVHRATFYSHYTDVYDLYSQMENNAIEELNLIFSSDPTHTYNGIIDTIVNYVYDRPKLCRLFLDKNLSREFYEKIGIFLEEKCIENYLFESKKKELSEECKYFVNYHTQGCLSIVSRWTKRDFDCSKEKIIEIISKIDEHFDVFVAHETGT